MQLELKEATISIVFITGPANLNGLTETRGQADFLDL